jgi:hypothetical protein
VTPPLMPDDAWSSAGTAGQRLLTRRISRASLLSGAGRWLAGASSAAIVPRVPPPARRAPRPHRPLPPFAAAMMPDERSVPRVSFQSVCPKRYTPQSLLDAETIRIAFLGDCGVRSQAAAEVAQEVHRWEPDVVALLGDLDYSDDGDVDVVGPYYGRYMHPYCGRADGEPNGVNRLVAVPGDHDLQRGKRRGFERYYDVVTRGYNYRYRAGPVELFALNSVAAIIEPNAQMLWLRAALAESLADQRVAWRFVLSSTPPDSSGRHGSCARLQWPYAAWGADGVWSGDNHSYERLFHGLVACPEAVFGDQLNLINGMGGHSLYANQPEPLAGTLRRLDGADGDFGFSLMEASLERARFWTVSRRGVVMDAFTLRKAAPARPPFRRLLLTEGCS